MKEILFNIPYIVEKQARYAEQAIISKRIAGDGKFTKMVHGFLEREFNTKKALLTTSCTSALEMASLLLNLKEGDEVILPSYTFVSTANAIVLRGARPVFAEVQPDTLNIDPKDIERKITKKTRAVFPVHYAGVACDMDSIMDIAGNYKLKVVEDAAQGVTAKYKGQFLGTIGDIGCYSFHESKNYSCGEGGAILINSDKDLMERAEIIREKGTNRSKFFRGEVDKYTWTDIGSSYLPADILAAFLLGQLEDRHLINARRKTVFDYYCESLKPLEEKGLLQLPTIPKECQPNFHIFYILVRSEETRNGLIDRLKEKGIQSFFHYVPLHLSPMGKKLGYEKGMLPLTEDLSQRLLRLPIYPDLSMTDLEYIVGSIYQIIQ
ncbi:dTDP-4-amino-4,6-dideoxygalactose transaminase [Phosphitispora fastidiosa]|uniref:dTDP-4-amino-4,6-dideoxygalactose transaminase n=1 Tax=Phosphitispora fastidiosa TaxID=2837202 RepID=UPI001E65523A|nr:dTDP-4-amino-4,6-dideoxygalactose transaminase [Phosphitispora fastidiosa]MBU7006394.1 dTDP-4-amino-4 [Phosphitispora fastidiosa]